MQLTGRILIVFLLLTLSASDVFGLVSTHRDVNQEQRHYHEFRLRQQTVINVSARCETRGNAPQFRVWIDVRTPQGTWGGNELLIQTNQASNGQTTITLPEGDYRITITARRMEYWFTMTPGQ